MLGVFAKCSKTKLPNQTVNEEMSHALKYWDSLGLVKSSEASPTPSRILCGLSMEASPGSTEYRLGGPSATVGLRKLHLTCKPNELETALVGDLHGPKLMTLAVATYMCRPEAAVGGFTVVRWGDVFAVFPQSSHELVKASIAVLNFA